MWRGPRSRRLRLCWGWPPSVRARGTPAPLCVVAVFARARPALAVRVCSHGSLPACLSAAASLLRQTTHGAHPRDEQRVLLAARAPADCTQCPPPRRRRKTPATPDQVPRPAVVAAPVALAFAAFPPEPLTPLPVHSISSTHRSAQPPSSHRRDSFTSINSNVEESVYR